MSLLIAATLVGVAAAAAGHAMRLRVERSSAPDIELSYALLILALLTVVVVTT